MEKLLLSATRKSHPFVDFFHVKDLTHYFVMTAKKDSLVRKGVIRKDTGDLKHRKIMFLFSR